jgi:hypothetical protein
MIERFARPREEPLTRMGEMNSAMVTDKQRHPDLVLKIADAPANRGLLDIERSGGFPKASVFGCGQEVAQVTKFYRGKRLRHAPPSLLCGLSKAAWCEAHEAKKGQRNADPERCGKTVPDLNSDPSRSGTEREACGNRGSMDRVHQRTRMHDTHHHCRVHRNADEADDQESRDGKNTVCGEGSESRKGDSEIGKVTRHAAVIQCLSIQARDGVDRGVLEAIAATALSAWPGAVTGR